MERRGVGLVDEDAVANDISGADAVAHTHALSPSHSTNSQQSPCIAYSNRSGKLLINAVNHVSFSMASCGIALRFPNFSHGIMGWSNMLAFW